MLNVSDYLKCSSCKILKQKTEFNPSTNDRGYRYYCKECEKNKREAKKDKQKIYNKNWYEKNKDKALSKNREYQKSNKDVRNALQRKNIKTNINFKLKMNLRSRLRQAIKTNQKSGSAVSDLGCSIEELKLHIESKFLEGMTWENWSRDGWHIDHIKPLSSFDLADRQQLLEACHYTNLQPLWAIDNYRKGSL